MAELLAVDDLRTHFDTEGGVIRAVDGVSFTIGRGETLGVVGESGSGKSVTFLSLLGLVPSPPGRVVGGTARFGGIDLLRLAPAELRAIRGRRIAVVFQDPMTALNPYMRVGRQIAEGMELHLGLGRRQALARAAELLERVGIAEPARRLDDHPHEMSGGMRQRVMIAIALSCEPELLVADEPTTALDVTVQAQILELLRSISKERGMALALVSHDFGVVAGMADRVAVMYGGKIVEEAPVDEIFERPAHPYTRGLLASVTRLGACVGEDLPAIPGAPPEPGRLPPGCPFQERCAHAVAACGERFPDERLLSPGHRVHCHVELPS